MTSVLERTRVPLSVKARARETAPPDAAGRPRPPDLPLGWVRLNFDMQHQEQDQWCWAAVSTSIALYFGGEADWKQCTVVNEELRLDSCCADGGSDACNRWWYLDRALRRTGNLESMHDGAPADIEDVFGQIDARRPVGLRIGWRGGGGHFIAIEGYRGDGNAVAVEDPWYGTSDVDVATLRTAYHGTGTWTHVYYTKAPG